MTVYDVEQLKKYALPRRERAESDQYRMLANIIKVASFHEQGGAGEFKKLLSQLEVHDDAYVDRPLDLGALKMLAAKVDSNRALTR